MARKCVAQVAVPAAVPAIAAIQPVAAFRGLRPHEQPHGEQAAQARKSLAAIATSLRSWSTVRQVNTFSIEPSFTGSKMQGNT